MAAESSFDAFVSYSHAADGLLAPRLQAGLQRFAKPWWRRRALRVFRDESSLSANPHLWGSITEALDSSEWFVVLLSPDAARSEWVNQEIAYWVEHKDSSRVIPVLTAGEFGWSDGDVSGDAAPEALRGVFSEEPRWVDLRFARSEEQLDLQDPRFADAVADIASAIRGVAKDELASEEVKQHRRTVRTAWAAGVAVVVLGVAAAVGAVVAVGQSSEARSQRDEAERQTQIAQDNEQRATENEQRALDAEDEALAERDRADREAQIARSNELAAASTSALDSNPELATLLAILSITETPDGSPPSAEAIRALRLAGSANRLEQRHVVARDDSEVPTNSRVVLSPDGRTIYYSAAVPRKVGAIDLATGEDLWVQELEGTPEIPIWLAVSPDGEHVAVTVYDWAVEPDLVPRDEFPARVLVLAADKGDVVATIPLTCGEWPSGSLGGFSADGSVLIVNSGREDCGTAPDADWVSFVSTDTWTETDRLSLDGVFGEWAMFARDADVLLLGGQGGMEMEVRSFPGLDTIQRFEGSFAPGDPPHAAISAGGSAVAIQLAGDPRLAIHDVASGRFLGYVEGQGRFWSDVAFSPDGQLLVVATRRSDVIVDATSGALIAEVGDDSTTNSAALAPDGATLVTIEQSATVLVWTVSEGGSEAGSQIGTGEDVAVHVNGNWIREGPNPAVIAFTADAFETGLPILRLYLFDERIGETSDSLSAVDAVQTADGRFVVAEQESVLGPDGEVVDLRLGGLVIWDPESGDSTEIASCRVLKSELDDPTGDVPRCGDHPAYGADLRLSPAGTLAAASAAWTQDTMMIGVWDLETQALHASLEVASTDQLLALGDEWVAVSDQFGEFITVHDLEDGGIVFAGRVPLDPLQRSQFVGGTLLGSLLSEVAIVDVKTWDDLGRWTAHRGAFVRGWAVSPDGSRLATSGEDGTVRVWDVAEVMSGVPLAEGEAPRLLDEIPTDIVSDIRWITDDLLGLVTRSGAWLTVTLDPDVLLADAVLGLTRSFTAIECQAYRIEPCPSLEELRADG